MTKLPHYVLPLYPAIAILIVGVLERRTLSEKRWLTIGSMSWFVLPAVLALLGVVGAVALVGHPVFAAWPLLPPRSCSGCSRGFCSTNAARNAPCSRALRRASLSRSGSTRSCCRHCGRCFSVTMRVLRDSPCNAPRATAAGFHEPSLIFLTGNIDASDRTAPAQADFLRQGILPLCFRRGASRTLLRAARPGHRLALRRRRSH